jgi:hypothetical protein
MVVRRGQYYADPSIGAGVEALAEGIFGGGEREAARARAGLLRAQTTAAEFENQRFQRRAQNAARVGELLRMGAAGTPEERAARNAEIYGLRAEDDAQQQAALPAFLRGYSYSQPLVPLGEREAAYVGAGGNWGGTESGNRFEQGEATRRAGISAGATVSAARIGQEGANWRFLRGDVNPGGDGVYVAPDRARALNLVPPAPTPLPPGAAGPEMPAPGPVFLPGSASIAPGNVRATVQPGPVQGGVPVVTLQQGNPTLNTEQGRAAQTVTNPAASEGERALAASILPGVMPAQIRADAGGGAGSRTRNVSDTTARAIASDLDAELTARDMGSLDPAARQIVLQRAQELYQDPRAGGSPSNAVRLAMDEALAAGLDTRRSLLGIPGIGGRTHFLPPGVSRLGVEAAPLVPRTQQTPPPAGNNMQPPARTERGLVPQQNVEPPPPAIPPRPQAVPAGSQYSPSRRQWRDPRTNRVFDESGRPMS